VPAILVGGAQLERGDQFAVPFQFDRRQDAGFAGKRSRNHVLSVVI
jgi:hypothetical protein